MKIVAFNDQGFGDGADITEAVQALYDLVLASQDYGSGFWSYEDAAPVLKLGKLMGWDGTEELQKYHDKRVFEQEQAVFCKEKVGWYASWDDRAIGYWSRDEFSKPDGSIAHRTVFHPHPHDHEFSVTGKCLWPRCPEVNSEH